MSPLRYVVIGIGGTRAEVLVVEPDRLLAIAPPHRPGPKLVHLRTRSGEVRLEGGLAYFASTIALASDHQLLSRKDDRMAPAGVHQGLEPR